MNNSELINKFYKEILQIKKRFEDLEVTPKTVTTSEFAQIVADLKKFLSRREFSRAVENLQKDAKLAKLAVELRTIYNQYYFYLEKKIAESVISNKAKKLFLSNNSKLGDEEAKCTKLDEKSHVFWIGSGPFPWTAINYATKKRCRVSCIDNNPTAVTLSNRLIKTIGLVNFISIFQRLAQKVDYSQATHVVIAAMAQPKSAILKQIYKTSKIDVKVIVRSSFSLYFFMYPRVNQHELKNFKVDQIISAGSNSELISYILSKKVNHE